MVRRNPEGGVVKGGGNSEEVESSNEGPESRLPVDASWKADVKSNQ